MKKVLLHQALHYAFRLGYRRIARLVGLTRDQVRDSFKGVTPWYYRSSLERRAGIREAKRLLRNPSGRD